MKKRRRDAGFSLAALIFFATAASILAAAAVPAYQMQAKREREKELIFRGEEYTRAIQKYQRKFGVNPGSIDQLVQTNGLRFLRRAYKDPITGKDFRLIRINPDGSLSGSKLFAQNVNPQSLFGNTQIFGQQPGAQQPGAQQPGVQQPGMQQPGMQQPGVQQLGMQQPGMQQPGMQQPLSFGQQPQGSFGQQAPMIPSQQPVQPGQVPGQGFPGQQPFPTPIPGSPSASPFGPQPGPTPFGPTMPFGSPPGPQQGQQPFGFGNPPAVPGQPAPAKRP